MGLSARAVVADGGEVRLTIDLDESNEPIGGSVHAAGVDRDFTTWLGLLTALRDAVELARATAATTSEEPTP